MNDHTLSSYDDELNELRGIFVRMGGLAGAQTQASMAALAELDAAAAARIRDADQEIDDLETAAEQSAMGIFARRAPVADDLREVVSVLKMTTMVERMGDYAKNIAKRAIAITEGPMVVMPKKLDEMALRAHAMVDGAIDAYVTRDEGAALEVWERDEVLDQMYSEAYRQIIARMVEMPEHSPSLTHYLMTAKNLERIGDQATNVAEQVFYVVTGRRIEDERAKRDTTSELP